MVYFISKYGYRNKLLGKKTPLVWVQCIALLGYYVIDKHLCVTNHASKVHYVKHSDTNLANTAYRIKLLFTHINHTLYVLWFKSEHLD